MEDSNGFAPCFSPFPRGRRAVLAGANPRSSAVGKHHWLQKKTLAGATLIATHPMRMVGGGRPSGGEKGVQQRPMPDAALKLARHLTLEPARLSSAVAS